LGGKESRMITAIVAILLLNAAIVIDLLWVYRER
jgi:hypothetical protein